MQKLRLAVRQGATDGYGEGRQPHRRYTRLKVSPQPSSHILTHACHPMGLKPSQTHRPWWSQVVPTPEDAGAVPPRSKARRGLPQVHTPGGTALPGRTRGGSEQHPWHGTPSSGRHHRSRAGAARRPQGTHCPGRGRTPHISGASPRSKKKLN